jgi:hypothetical protein
MSNKRNAAKTAGAIYLMTILAAVLNMIFIESKLSVEGDIVHFVNNIIDNQMFLRMSIMFEFIMFSSVFVLAVCLYKLTKDIQKEWAILALVFRAGEAVIGGLAVLIGLGVLLLMNGQYTINHELIYLLLELRSYAYYVLYGFMSLGSIIIFVLFYKGKFIPKALSIYGIITYILMLSMTVITILVPNPSELIEMFILAPGALFEVLIGIWLLFKIKD